MENRDTHRRLAEITDEGAFERLATAVLRKASALYSLVSHPGINVEGKTVKSPVDGIAFVPGATPPNLIVIHHTITVSRDLEGKWLHNPAKVKSRSRSGKPTQPAGDVTKTAEIVSDERIRTPNLKATLVLTTNQDPGERIIREVHAAGAAADLTIDVWPRSRIADFLDNDPDGQWLRRQYLGIEQERISDDLLRKLSDRSLQAAVPPGDPDMWIERELDRILTTRNQDRALFLVAQSGSGKSVACYKRLQQNFAAGGFSIVLSDEDLAGSPTLDQSLETALRKLHPALAAGCGSAVRQLATARQPLLITVEDINRSGRGGLMIERIARWSEVTVGASEGWQIICPVWPQIVSSLSDNAQKYIQSKIVYAPPMNIVEGGIAVQRRYYHQGKFISDFDASAISEELGHDPLLIALHDLDSVPSPDRIIGQFVESSLQRLSATRQEYTPAEYRYAIRKMAGGILQRRRLDPEWPDLVRWSEVVGHASALRHIIQQGEVIRITGHSTGERLAFRHDRVREWLLADGFQGLLLDGDVSESLLSDPFFAEVFGVALANGLITPEGIAIIIDNNPLSGFCALRHIRAAVEPHQREIIDRVSTWVETNDMADRGKRYFKFEAARMLAECEGPHILPIIAKFGDQSWNSLRARFRNGDLIGGIALCQLFDLGTQVGGFDEFIEHVKQRYGQALITALADFLCRAPKSGWGRIGALRLAGHLAAPGLFDAVKACWDLDANRGSILGEYLWASAECAADMAQAEVLLKPICDLWAAIPASADENRTMSSRMLVVDLGVRWAFQRKTPEAAIEYLIERAKDEDLNWPIFYLLDGVDHPSAVEFLAREIGRREAKLEASGGFWHYPSHIAEQFQRKQKENGRAMSESARLRLLPLWKDRTESDQLRKSALRLWSATTGSGDIEHLQNVLKNDSLFDQALWQRVRRGDSIAIPILLEKLRDDQGGYWWQLGRDFWNDDMTQELDAALIKRSSSKESAADWILSEMIMNLPSARAESMLLRHWSSLCYRDYYIASALFFATPALLAAVSEAVQQSVSPRELFKYLSIRVRRTRGRDGTGNGFFQYKQVAALLPYLDYLDESEIFLLWETCNKNRWYDFRRQYLDSRLSEKWRNGAYMTEEKILELLDEEVKRSTRWVDHWVDRCQESGWTSDETLNFITKWCIASKTILSLEMLVLAIIHTGSRMDITRIDQVNIPQEKQVDAIRVDTAFAVRRRALI